MKTNDDAVVVEVLHRAAVDRGGLDLGAGVEGLVDGLVGLDVLQLGAHERGALARLHVLELDDGPELAFDVENHAVLQVVRRCHARVSAFVRRVGSGGRPDESGHQRRSLSGRRGAPTDAALGWSASGELPHDLAPSPTPRPRPARIGTADSVGPGTRSARGTPTGRRQRLGAHLAAGSARPRGPRPDAAAYCSALARGLADRGVARLAPSTRRCRRPGAGCCRPVTSLPPAATAALTAPPPCFRSATSTLARSETR